MALEQAGDPLTTLLEEAIVLPGFAAFFHAATLLETLTEHFCEHPSRLHCPGLKDYCHDDPQLTIGRTPIGFTLPQLLSFRDAPAPLISISWSIYFQGNAPDATALSRLRQHADLLRAASTLPGGEIWCYTDGSFSPAH